MAMSLIWTAMVGAAILCGLATGNGPAVARGALDGAAAGVTTATIYRELKRGETGELDKHFRPAYSAEAAERAVRLSIRNRGRRKADK